MDDAGSSGRGRLTAHAYARGEGIRFSHFGYLDAFDTLGAVSALELTLAAQGYKFERGAGVAAAQKVFMGAMLK